MKQRIFVFGSNLAGRHGRGSALAALRRHGAVFGQGRGLQGRSYAIPTKDERLRTLPLSAIALNVSAFLTFSRANPEMEFDVVAVGCGLAGYSPKEITPMFRGAPENVHLPREFRKGETP